jgi:hypothetical protein
VPFLLQYAFLLPEHLQCPSQAPLEVAVDAGQMEAVGRVGESEAAIAFGRMIEDWVFANRQIPLIGVVFRVCSRYEEVLDESDLDLVPRLFGLLLERAFRAYLRDVVAMRVPSRGH